MTNRNPHFTLYSRSWCHLCEDMLAALRAFMARDELVPVLFGEDLDGPELCHYFLDEAALRRHLKLAQPA
jgi:hypothetical protein